MKPVVLSSETIYLLSQGTESDVALFTLEQQALKISVQLFDDRQNSSGLLARRVQPPAKKGVLSAASTCRAVSAGKSGGSLKAGSQNYYISPRDCGRATISQTHLKSPPVAEICGSSLGAGILEEARLPLHNNSTQSHGRGTGLGHNSLSSQGNSGRGWELTPHHQLFHFHLENAGTMLPKSKIPAGAGLGIRRRSIWVTVSEWRHVHSGGKAEKAAGLESESVYSVKSTTPVTGL